MLWRSLCSYSTECSDVSWWRSAPRRCPSRQPWTSKDEQKKKREKNEEKEKRKGEKIKEIFIQKAIIDLVIYSLFFNFLTFYWRIPSELKVARIWMIQKQPYTLLPFTQIQLLLSIAINILPFAFLHIMSLFYIFKYIYKWCVYTHINININIHTSPSPATIWALLGFYS